MAIASDLTIYQSETGLTVHVRSPYLATVAGIARTLRCRGHAVAEEGDLADGRARDGLDDMISGMEQTFEDV